MAITNFGPGTFVWTDGMTVGEYYQLASPNGYGFKKGMVVQIESLT